MSDLVLRRKWTLKAHNSQIVLIKKPIESAEHVVMKALLWALYLPQYSQIQVEVSIGTHYKPDLIALDDQQQPIFWGEAGRVSEEKFAALFKRYKHTHFAFAKWHTRLEPLDQQLRRIVATTKRHAPIDLLNLPSDSVERFIASDGTITLDFADLDWRRIEAT